MRSYISGFPKALLEVTGITQTRHATGQHREGTRTQRITHPGNRNAFGTLLGLVNMSVKMELERGRLILNACLELLETIVPSWPNVYTKDGQVWCGADFLHRQKEPSKSTVDAWEQCQHLALTNCCCYFWVKHFAITDLGVTGNGTIQYLRDHREIICVDVILKRQDIL